MNFCNYELLQLWTLAIMNSRSNKYEFKIKMLPLVFWRKIWVVLIIVTFIQQATKHNIIKMSWACFEPAHSSPMRLLCHSNKPETFANTSSRSRSLQPGISLTAALPSKPAATFRLWVIDIPIYGHFHTWCMYRNISW